MYTTYELHNIFNATKNAIGYNVINEAARAAFSSFGVELLPCGEGIELNIPDSTPNTFDPNKVMIDVFSNLIANNITKITRHINETCTPVTEGEVANIYNNFTYVNQLFITVGMLSHKFFIIKY